MGMAVPAHRTSLGVQDLGGALTNDTVGPCVVDLEHAAFVEPSGHVAIAAVVDRAAAEGQHVEFVAPASADCRSYLSRMRLGQHLDRLGVTHSLEPVREHEAPRLSELRWFHDEKELEHVAEVIVRQYQESGSGVVEPLYLALFELAVNAVQHSGRGGGYVALQSYRSSGEVAFAIADSGVGLRGSLNVDNDGEAIAMAAQKYSSSEVGRGRGRGITGVIDLTGRHRGAVNFITGTAHGRFSGGHRDPRVLTMDARFLGTLVDTRLSQKEG